MLQLNVDDFENCGHWKNIKIRERGGLHFTSQKLYEKYGCMLFRAPVSWTGRAQGECLKCPPLTMEYFIYYYILPI